MVLVKVSVAALHTDAVILGEGERGDQNSGERGGSGLRGEGGSGLRAN